MGYVGKGGTWEKEYFAQRGKGHPDDTLGGFGMGFFLPREGCISGFCRIGVISPTDGETLQTACNWYRKTRLTHSQEGKKGGTAWTAIASINLNILRQGVVGGNILGSAWVYRW